MARPKKNNAEYFSHDNNMRNDMKIKALRRKFGLNGYAIFNMLLEVLTDAENFHVKIGNLQIQLLAGDFDCEPDLLYDLIEFCISVELLEKDGENVFSSGLKKRLSGVISKRETAKEVYQERLKKAANGGVSVAEINRNDSKPIVSVTETTQSKDKVNKTKVNNEDKSSLEVAFDSFIEMRKKIKKPVTENIRQLLEKKLKNLAPDEETQVRVLEQSTLNCWQDLYELKEEKNKEGPQKGIRHIIEVQKQVKNPYAS